MNPNGVIDLGREAIHLALLVGGPILVLSLVIGIGIGMLQAMTQVQDQAVSFVPKLMGMLLAVGVALPWLAGKMVDYTEEVLATPFLQPFHGSDQVPSTMRQVSTSRAQEKMATDPENANPDRQDLTEDRGQEDLAPEKIPFQLPHYRFSRLSKGDQEL